MALGKALKYIHERGYSIVGLDEIKVYPNISVETTELIDELKEDMFLFKLDPNQLIRIYLNEIQGTMAFDDYEFDIDEFKTIDSPYCELTVDDALKVLQYQNEIFD